MRSSLAAIARLLSIPVIFATSGCASPTDADPTAEVSADLSSNESAAYSYFVGKGLTDYQAAGIVGNLMQESNVLPTSVQAGGPGRGIAQWSVGGRWNSSTNDNVEWYATKEGASATSLDLQLDFIWYELQTFPSYGFAELKASATISEATIVFQDDFEICGACNESTRITYAQQVLSAMGGSSGGGSSGGGSSTPASCYSNTLGKEMPANACVQSRSDNLWYQCDNGTWVDRWDDPTACSGVYPL